VVSGQATGVVVGTGDSAEIGQISRLVTTVSTVRNNLLHQLEILGRWLACLVAVIALLAFLLALLHAKNNFKVFPECPEGRGLLPSQALLCLLCHHARTTDSP
jgi:magnesium-transporting ATPase (P-type)